MTNQPLQFKRQHRAEIDINLTPLIDVVFLLLIFFMVSTSFTREAHLSIILPEAENTDDSAANNDSLDVIIDKEGFYRVASKLLVDSKPSTLASALRLESEDDFERPIRVSADKDAPYQRVVQVIDIAGQLGFVQVNLSTQASDNKPIEGNSGL